MALPLVAVLGTMTRLVATLGRALPTVGRAVANSMPRLNAKEFLRGLRKLERELNERAKQERYAIAVALTRTARDAAQDVNAAMPRYLDRPTAFTQRAARFRPANKVALASWVYIQPKQAEYLKYQIYGGKRLPRKRALVLPTDLPTDRYGNIPRGQIQRLLRRKDVFSGRVRGIPGIWQRSGKGLLLLVAYEPTANYNKRLPFEQIVKMSRDKNFPRHLEAARKMAAATARRA